MSLAVNPVVGTIRIEPDPNTSYDRLASDDSTLEALLCSLASSDLPAAGEEPVVLIAETRLSRRRSWTASSIVAVSADVTRLLDDLQAEYDELTSSLAD